MAKVERLANEWIDAMGPIDLSKPYLSNTEDESCVIALKLWIAPWIRMGGWLDNFHYWMFQQGIQASDMEKNRASSLL